ncbi:hypothetical protein [Tengunoibacter tsumagoiensis]|nr:hypothetical protein [Tengunoibacter tsumagoiensis]
MKKYCKAYFLKDLRQFPDWSEQQDESPLGDEDVVYLWDDFTVVKSPIVPEKGIIWQHVTPEWQDFCKSSLKFEIPDDLRYAY